MPSFENLHKNKKLAFIDGFGSAAIIAAIAFHWYREEKEDDHKSEIYSTRSKTYDRAYKDGFHAAINEANHHFIDMEKTTKLCHFPEN